MTDTMQPRVAAQGRWRNLLRDEELCLWLFIAVAAYHVVGMFPLMTLFGDGIGIANGVTYMIEGGAELNNGLSYRFSQHPGTHMLVAVVTKLTGASAYSVFLVLSAIAAAAAILLGAVLIRNLLGCPLGIGGIALLLFQETYSAGYYANSTVLAGAVSLGALCLLATRDHWPAHLVAGVLFGLAVFLRLDLILLAPVVIPLVHRGPWKTTVARSLVVGAIAGVVWAATYFGSGASLTDIMAAMQDKDDLFSYARETQNSVSSHLAFFSVLSMFLMVIGVASLVTQGKYRVLVVMAAAIIPFYVIFPHGLGTSRYLYYFAPFFALPVAQALWNVRPYPRRTWFVYAALIAVLFAGQYVLGARLVTTDEGNTSVRWRLGPGKPVVGVTNNGGRLFTGVAHSPLWHREQKQVAQAQENDLAVYLAGLEGDSLQLYSIGWTAMQITVKVLLSQGATLLSEETDRSRGWSRFVFDRGGQRLSLVYYRSVAVDRALLKPETSPLREMDHPGSIAIVRTYWARALGMEEDGRWQQVIDLVYARDPA